MRFMGKADDIDSSPKTNNRELEYSELLFRKNKMPAIFLYLAALSVPTYPLIVCKVES